MTPAYALANVFLPNLIKLKGRLSVMQALERRDLVFFDSLWAQAQIRHNPYVWTQARSEYRIATMTLPEPREMGEAHMAAIVLKSTDNEFLRYFTLEHEYAVNKQANRTQLCEREGNKHTRRGEGPALTGKPEADAAAFVDCLMKLVAPHALAPLKQ